LFGSHCNLLSLINLYIWPVTICLRFWFIN
jgi:hypothetical protein